MGYYNHEENRGKKISLHKPFKKGTVLCIQNLSFDILLCAISVRFDLPNDAEDDGRSNSLTIIKG